jgi:diguanylate cyclase (GGDEF)-like protein
LAARVVGEFCRALVDPIAIPGLAAGLIEPGAGLASCVRRAAELRRLAHRELTNLVPPEEAAATGAAVDAVLDQALETAAGRLAGALEQAAFLDPLTGLPNRRALDVDLDRAVANAGRAGAALTVVMVDLDGLKARNDTAGHAAGDAALRHLGQTVQAHLRRGDSAYRIGGDEFVLLLPALVAEAAGAVIERVRASGPPPFSWGAATFPADGASPAALLRVADARLYQKRGARRAAAGVALAAAARRPHPRSGGWARLVGVGLQVMTLALPAGAVALLVSSRRPPSHAPVAATSPSRVTPTAPARGPGRSG